MRPLFAVVPQLISDATRKLPTLTRWHQAAPFARSASVA
jgi:hypothetical protein